MQNYPTLPERLNALQLNTTFTVYTVQLHMLSSSSLSQGFFERLIVAWRISDTVETLFDVWVRYDSDNTSNIA